MYKFPMIFKVSSSTENGMNSLWTTQANTSPPLTCAIPPEFNGPGGGYSPEDFYALALANCFIATFKVFAQNSKLEFKKLNVNAELAVDRNDKGLPWMARMNFQVHIEGTDNRELAQRVLDKTSKGCLVLNSVNTEKHFEFHIS
jgi:organic hydroperoxide reductase OsmC/OhrA